MKLVYIAGPYRAGDHLGRERNILEARFTGAQVACLGAYPVIPQSNTAHFDDVVTDETFWLDGTMELLRRCDAVMLVPGWEGSSGARAEAVEAERLGIPVFENLTCLEQWLERNP